MNIASSRWSAVLLFLALFMPGKDASACEPLYSLYDYYSDGDYIGSFWEPNGQFLCDHYGPIDDGGGHFGGGGGGGGSGSGGNWVSALGLGPGDRAEINVETKTVRVNMVNCQSDFSSLGQAATYYTTIPGLTSNFPVGNAQNGPFVTLITPNGRQQFYRFATGGSIQFGARANSACGGAGWTP